MLKKIHRKGVFANKDFKKNEIVIKWKKLKLIDKSNLKKIAKRIKNIYPTLKEINISFMESPKDILITHVMQIQRLTD